MNRNYFIELADFHAFKEKNKKNGLFTTAYRYDSANIREANMIGSLYIDFDIANIDDRKNFELIRKDAIRVLSALKAIFGIPYDMIHIYFSGSKGIHIVVPHEIMGIKPNQELNRIFKLMAQDLNKLATNQTVDTRIYDKVRLFRVPNSLHPKTNLYKIPLTVGELMHDSLLEIKLKATQPRIGEVIHKKRYIAQANRVYQSYLDEWEKVKIREINAKNKRGESQLDFRPACIEYLLTNPLPEGNRNNTVAVLASYMMQRGLKESEAVEHLLNWNSEFCDPPLPKDEIDKTTQSIYRAQHKYGCGALRELSVCDTKCPIYK